ncbi:MAG: hypothetical protein JXM70_13790 [Pirellulales bacterium]|nr:hypothetical protein [Pirellulales bacterium]
MSIQFDPADDFPSIVDCREAITLCRPGSSTTATTSGALRRAVTVQEAETSRGEYTLEDVVWHLPASDISEPPGPADVIVDGNDMRWTILAVVRATADSRWRCVCRNLAISRGLDQFVDIERAVFTKDIHGAQCATWHLWRTGLAAKIQTLGADNTGAQQRDVTVAEYRIILADTISLDHTHRLKGPDGTRYKIMGFKKPDRIDALVEVMAVRFT